jgi:phage shock protein PspC (stress-responsive transcriptional regulator)
VPGGSGEPGDPGTRSDSDIDPEETTMDDTPFPPETTRHRAPRRFVRSSTNRVVSGVCGGVAEYWGGDPTMVRLATAILGLITGIIPMVILYIVVAIVVPERGVGQIPEAAPYASTGRPGNGAVIVGLILIVIGVLAFARETLRIDTDLLWPLGLIGIGAAFILLTFRR